MTETFASAKACRVFGARYVFEIIRFDKEILIQLLSAKQAVRLPVTNFDYLRMPLLNFKVMLYLWSFKTKNPFGYYGKKVLSAFP